MKNYLFILPVLLLVGCAHSINIAPNLSNNTRSDVKQIDVNVGYYISSEDLAREVISPGGGGDKVKYHPYKELEPALFKTFSNIFRRAYAMKSPTDKAAIQANDITFVFIPKIETISSSDSMFTWPPTMFQVKLTCQALNRDGNKIWEQQVTGQGNATFSEFKGNFSLAAQKASEQAIAELQSQLNVAPELHKGVR